MANQLLTPSPCCNPCCPTTMTSLADMIADAGNQTLEYDVNPTTEGLAPGDLDRPATAYQEDGTGPTYTWNTTSHEWQLPT